MHDDHATPAVEVRGLHKRFGRQVALAGVDLTAHAGQVTGFLGANGAGKSTTLRILNGLASADAGTAHVLGKPYRWHAHPTRVAGAVLESGTFDPAMTGLDHLRTYCALGGHPQGGIALLGPERMNPPMPGPGTPEGVRGLLALLVLSAPVPVMLGSRAMTREYATRTVPRRERVVLAKLGVHLAAGIAYGALVALGAVVGVLGCCAVLGVAPGLPPAEIVELAVRLGLSMALYTLVGVGIGALAQRPQAALAVAIGWFYLAESFVSALPGVGRLYPWLPGGAPSALTGQSFVTDAIAATAGTAGVALLPAWAGGLVLVGYAALGCVLALVLTMRRDVT